MFGQSSDLSSERVPMELRASSARVPVSSGRVPREFRPGSLRLLSPARVPREGWVRGEGGAGAAQGASAPRLLGQTGWNASLASSKSLSLIMNLCGMLPKCCRASGPKSVTSLQLRNLGGAGAASRRKRMWQGRRAEGGARGSGRGGTATHTHHEQRARGHRRAPAAGAGAPPVTKAGAAP